MPQKWFDYLSLSVQLYIVFLWANISSVTGIKHCFSAQYLFTWEFQLWLPKCAIVLSLLHSVNTAQNMVFTYYDGFIPLLYCQWEEFQLWLPKYAIVLSLLTSVKIAQYILYIHVAIFQLHTTILKYMLILQKLPYFKIGYHYNIITETCGMKDWKWDHL